MEVKLKVFLNMGEEHIEHLKLIWSTDDKKRRGFLKREYLSAGSISGTFYTRDKNVPLKEKLKHYNGIIALDFDDMQDVEACKQKIALDDYDDWRTIAMSLSNLGEAGYEIPDKVSQFSKNYDEKMRAPAKDRKKVLVEPEYVQIVLSDFTTEVLVRQHKINPRSLAVYVDELIGFIKCFNKYRSGNDEQIWTQLCQGWH